MPFITMAPMVRKMMRMVRSTRFSAYFLNAKKVPMARQTEPPIYIIMTLSQCEPVIAASICQSIPPDSW